MDALKVLQKRVSSAILEEPAPTQNQLREMFESALRAPDHGTLTPWRFLTIEGDARPVSYTHLTLPTTPYV